MNGAAEELLSSPQDPLKSLTPLIFPFERFRAPSENFCQTFKTVTWDNMGSEPKRLGVTFHQYIIYKSMQKCC